MKYRNGVSGILMGLQEDYGEYSRISFCANIDCYFKTQAALKRMSQKVYIPDITYLLNRLKCQETVHCVIHVDKEILMDDIPLEYGKTFQYTYDNHYDDCHYSISIPTSKEGLEWWLTVPANKNLYENANCSSTADYTSLSGFINSVIAHKASETPKSQKKETKAVLDLKRRLKETEEKRDSYEKEHSVLKFKAEYVGCPNCGSKLKRTLLKSDKCPLCKTDMRSETTLTTLKGYDDKIKALKKKIAN